jgi:hypothetical protein
LDSDRAAASLGRVVARFFPQTLSLGGQIGTLIYD